MPNHLADETSPYLLQHQDNPVDWRPWGPEAIALSKEQQKPIFLSIGYSACHWCHVMAHESFENEEIAAYLNEHFICIKVDREERPDLDQIYMNAVQALTGRGGWPMSVFLTPDLKPFYGGTYWPATAGRGMPGFDQVLQAVNDAWVKRREQTLATADQLTDRLASTADLGGEGELNHGLLDAAVQHLQRSFDPRHGGFGPAPKFPHTMDLSLLLRMHNSSGRKEWLDMVRTTLDRMAAGGIYDHLGGGFARYSVDERWLVPHFEKMLYDNALLATVYAETHAVTGDDAYARIARETLDYVLRDMTGPDGGFYSAEDADSAPHDEPDGHKEEGLFYTWKPEEVRQLLGDDAADIFCQVYDISPIGNFEGRSIAWLPKSMEEHAKLTGGDVDRLESELAVGREKLLAERVKRPRPGLDDKVIAGWNGLMIDALARSGALLGEPRYTTAANRAVDFILNEMRDDSGRLLHTWRTGVAKLPAYLDDYTALANALVTLYEVTWDERRVDQAAALLEIVLERFANPDGGFYYTANDHEELIVRQKDRMDNATPGGASLAAMALLRLGKLTGSAKYLDAASTTLKASAAYMERAPGATSQMLAALDVQLGPTKELVLIGDSSSPTIVANLRRCYLPRCVIAGRIENAYHSPLLEEVFAGKTTIDGQPTLYICEGFACQEPAVGAAAIAVAVAEL